MNDAQRWAEKLAEADKFTYRQSSQYGENLYCLWSSDRDAWPNPKEVSKYVGTRLKLFKYLMIFFNSQVLV